VEGGSTSRFVDSSLRRFELIANQAFRSRYSLHLQGRPLRWPADPQQPVAVRFRQEALFPCLHPLLPVQTPLLLTLREQEPGSVIARWRLGAESEGFELLTEADRPDPELTGSATPWRGGREHDVTVDLRL
jgi:Putative amidoligase enzyme (DUF2126)